MRLVINTTEPWTSSAAMGHSAIMAQKMIMGGRRPNRSDNNGT